MNLSEDGRKIARGMKLKKILPFTANLLGFCISIFATILVTIILGGILVYGNINAVEPNHTILVLEIFIYLYGAVYLIFITAKWLRSLRNRTIYGT
jgi:hypothetical protein